MRRRGLLIPVLVLAVASACYQEPIAVTTFPPSASGTPTANPPTPAASPTLAATPSPEASPTQPSATPTALPSPSTSPSATSGTSPSVSPGGSPSATGAASSPPPVSGTPTTGCVDGWTSPPEDSAEYETGLAVLSGHLGVESAWTVDEMRYFTGPELPNVEPQYPVVERWYVRGALADDPNFRGRFIVERRTETIAGISAVAPYASVGYASPTWTGFVGEGPPTTYPGLPGQWSGIPYDFVTGAGDGGFPGLPEEVAGCLAGT